MSLEIKKELLPGQFLVKFVMLPAWSIALANWFDWSCGSHWQAWEHCVNSVCIRSFSGLYFSAFGLNMEIYGVNLCIQSKCRKRRTRITPNTDTFYAVRTPCTYSELEIVLSGYFFKQFEMTPTNFEDLLSWVLQILKSQVSSMCQLVLRNVSALHLVKWDLFADFWYLTRMPYGLILRSLLGVNMSLMKLALRLLF